MIRSMTGYAQRDFQLKHCKGSIEIKSVNHRFFDLALRIPNSLSSHEHEIRKLVRQYVSRGKLNLSLFLDNSLREEVSVNLELAESVVKSAEKMKKRFKLEKEITVTDILQVPNVVQLESSTQNSLSGWNQLRAEIIGVLENFVSVKEIEGTALKKDVSKRVANIKKLTSQIEKRRKAHASTALKKMKDRLKGLSSEVKVDDERLQKEVILWADKTDITEEIVRLKAHFKLFDEMLTKEICGKDLDFLIQEINRETNTIASKAQDAELSHLTVDIKGELERIREQIQNIE